MANFKEMANEVANDYREAMTLVCKLKKSDENNEQINDLFNIINKMYINQTALIGELILPDEEKRTEIDIPNFMLRRKVC